MPDPQPLTTDAIAKLLEPYLRPEDPAELPASFARELPRIYQQLTSYLPLILKWNARINLTAVREPEEIVRRHFGESLFAGLHLESGPAFGRFGGDSGPAISCDSLLDLGSGAGFPGIPIQLLYPALPVTLAESRTRKAAFLREVVRTLGLRSEVWAGRAEAIPSERRFHTVALRAVDEMDSAVAEAARRATHRILILGTLRATYPTLPGSFHLAEPIPLPISSEGALWIASRAA